MKKIITIFAATITAIACLCSCGRTEVNTKPTLNEWQKSVLEAQGLPTDYEQLTPKQQHTIRRIWEMISYLNEKYGEEFIYVDYIPAELNQGERLMAYPRSRGAGNGEYIVTVKAAEDGFADNCIDFNVSDFAEKLTNDFLTERFGDNYKYFSCPLGCQITMADMEDAKFQWKYGADNCIFITEEQCSINNIEDLTIDYVKFLNEHQISGAHRIEVLKEFPEDQSLWDRGGAELLGNKDGYSTGFYSFTIDEEDVLAEYVKYDPDSKRPWIPVFDDGTDYTLEEYLSKTKLS